MNFRDSKDMATTKLEIMSRNYRFILKKRPHK